jgi:hypothetical protein
MKNNSLNKLSVFSLGLLLSMNFIMAKAWTHSKSVNLDRLKKNIDFHRLSYIKAVLSYLELKEMQEAANFLEQHRIFLNDIFMDENARFALSQSFHALTQCIVRVNKFNIDSLHMDTGTLIDVGILELKGRVVATCSHCALVSHEESSQIKKCDVPNFLKLKHLKNETIVISD